MLSRESILPFISQDRNEVVLQIAADKTVVNMAYLSRFNTFAFAALNTVEDKKARFLTSFYSRLQTVIMKAI
jgi:uncharacterized membrane protein